MTKKEKIIVSAHTGVLMCDFSDVHKYIEEKLGRPVYTHELADSAIQKEVEEKSKEEFLEICSREEPERKTGKWINDAYDLPRCSCCGYMPEYNRHIDDYYYSDWCPNCGAKMDGGESK